MIFAIDFYYAASGEEDALRRGRQALSERRVALGLERGHTLWLAKGTPELPTVLWVGAFADTKAYDAQRWTLHFAEGYEQAHDALRAHCRRFERSVYALADGAQAAIAQPWVLHCWWHVPEQFRQMLLDSLKETAASAQDEPGVQRGDAILRRDDGALTLPYVICAAGFAERGRAFGALDATAGDSPEAEQNPMRPAYSLWQRLD